MGSHRDRLEAVSPDNQWGAVLMSAAVIIRPFIPRIEADPPGGWYVVFGSFGWLYGSRREALLAARDLTNEVRQ
jgi:hypothetical protein